MFLRQVHQALRGWSSPLVSPTWLTIVGITIMLFAISAASVRAWFTKTAINSSPVVIGTQSLDTSTAQNQGYVRRAQLRPQLRDVLKALGNRLERPGGERLMLIGTLSRSGNENLPVRLIIEYPDKLRLEEPTGVTIFDGIELKTSKNGLNQKDESEVESLLFDSVEHFFDGQMKGFAIRFLGAGFRTDNGTTPNYRGPLHDLYQVADQITLNREIRRQPKLYAFNSRTLLLERVSYQTNRAGSVIKVVVKIGGWRKLGNQFVPGEIAREENGVSVLSLRFASGTIASRIADSIFTRL